MERYINVNDITLKGVAVFDENLDLLIPLSDVRKALQLAPTADVVPKSEVAREIFEEIENALAQMGIVFNCQPILYELKNKYTEDQT